MPGDALAASCDGAITRRAAFSSDAERASSARIGIASAKLLPWMAMHASQPLTSGSPQ